MPCFEFSREPLEILKIMRDDEVDILSESPQPDKALNRRGPDDCGIGGELPCHVVKLR